MGFVPGKWLYGGSTFCPRSYLCWKAIRHGIPTLFGLSFRDGRRANVLGRWKQSFEMPLSADTVQNSDILLLSLERFSYIPEER